MMDQIEPRPQNNHDGHPKRRRLNAPSPGDTPAINRIVPSFNHSPVAASSLNQSPENRPTSDPSHADDEDSFTDRPFTQDPSLLLPPPSPTAILAAVKAAAVVVGLTYVPAPNELTPLEDIPPQEIDIIKRAISNFYHIDEPRDFQIQAIHYLPFHDNRQSVVGSTSPYCRWQISRAAHHINTSMWCDSCFGPSSRTRERSSGQGYHSAVSGLSECWRNFM
jgi:hypothetical protein